MPSSAGRYSGELRSLRAAVALYVVFCNRVRRHGSLHGMDAG